MSDLDYRYLQSIYSYEPLQLEKLCRISDLLAQVSRIPFLRDRLSLYGGTAINLIHLPRPQRLSIDVDFNYRHRDEETDWGEIRGRMDELIKHALYTLGYGDLDIKIDPSYPLCRFNVRYINHRNRGDSFNIETGYMRRMPLLAEDDHKEFNHLCRDIRPVLMTPKLEEILSNKWVTLLKRATPRDLYDAHSITKTCMDLKAFRKLAILDSFMVLKKPLTQIKPANKINVIQYDHSIRLVTRIDQEFNLELKDEVTEFSKGIISSITEKERRCIEKFYNEKKFKPGLLELNNINPNIENHPAILWTLSEKAI